MWFCCCSLLCLMCCFSGVRERSDLGKGVQWPTPPQVLTTFIAYAMQIHSRWAAHTPSLFTHPHTPSHFTHPHSSHTLTHPHTSHTLLFTHPHTSHTLLFTHPHSSHTLTLHTPSLFTHPHTTLNPLLAATRGGRTGSLMRLHCPSRKVYIVFHSCPIHPLVI